MIGKNSQKIHKGIDGFFNDIYGLYKRKTFSYKKLARDADYAYEVALSVSSMADEDFDIQMDGYRRKVRLGQEGEPVLRAVGFICDAARRSVNIRPFVEQVMGAMLIQGFAIQMQTGEGKTLTAAISAVLKCWKGFPCHVVTSNDYLAKRDAELMAPLYGRCGLSTGYVIAGMEPHERRAAYNRDIVYSTSKELLADYLRDMIANDYRPYDEGAPIRKASQKRVMRGLHAAIVDEADSVLADEATVPLIISVAGKNRLLKEAVMTALALSRTLNEGEDYAIDYSRRDITVTPQGKARIEEVLKDFPAIWSSYERSEYLIKQVLVAQHYYHRDVQYVIDDGKIIIVDEKTGRMMDGRKWCGGLHQAVEAKENVEITDVTESHIQMSFQMFFRLYKNLSGMSGTLQNIEKELWSIYELTTVKIPTHVPKQLIIFPEKLSLTVEQKWDAVIHETSYQISQGRAVLVGTRSIRDSEALHLRLNKLGIESTVLNALRHEQEAQIVAQAGKKNVVTIATNMAGRGTDILVAKEVQEAGGLQVVATERHESRRVDMQLFGRTARQGQPGGAHMMLSLEDEVMQNYSPAWLKRWLHGVLHTGIGRNMIVLLYVYFQRCAERTRSKVRKRILEQDLALSKVMSFTRF
jgi:preprotein translocase subunit SecA